ncbi:hypothetical protein LRS74_00390 [Streptomyces sp. LX-29]|uniref:hypothetical protein n=1 Tax=Streptomyces sp. LX-29 TaxID=2900152 RepID=UPI00240E2193|nr:hypothetical protein [Streptomyces sp. LX-29]WFB05642.1 hypothetical protein LRS74_00390 [Streptomyces sp. LX-29]
MNIAAPTSITTGKFTTTIAAVRAGTGLAQRVVRDDVDDQEGVVLANEAQACGSALVA